MTTENPIGLVLPRNVEEEVRESYLRYSLSVIISRALPDARDGLKPSQRRILYAMRQLNLTPNAKHRKCAKICGDTSGDYHPHGESVIYPTLVRLAQEWVMRYRLIDGQGNFGSVDGDDAAAMRYTEARLTHSATQLMEDLDKDTVEFVSNYDETKDEPTVFPAKFPNLLCNGCSGIAVGMATNIPPHNLKELIQATLLVLENPMTTIDEILTVMPGPDFPTGGIICGYKGIRDAFHTGRGKIVLRAVVAIEEMQDGLRHRLVVTELPYNVNKSRLIEHIADLINDKEISTISDLRDESDRNGLRIVIELKKGEIPDFTLNQLYKFTDLQSSFGCNILALDKGLPRTMNVKQLILAWIEHRIEVIRRRTLFELNKAEIRAHILEGFLRAIDVLDRVVQLIRSSDSKEAAKQELMLEMDFSDRQAIAILELRLYQLTGLEREKITQEHEELQRKIAYYRSLLADELLIRGVIRDELTEIAKVHTSPRLSQIIPADGEMDLEDLIPKETVVITLSGDDYIKRMPLDTFREQRRGGSGVAGFQMKREDDVLKALYVASTHETLLLITNFGRCYWLKVWQIPDTGRRSKGKPLVQLLEDLQPDEKIATALPVKDFKEIETSMLLVTKYGVVKKTDLESYSNPRRKGVYAINPDEGDEVVAARLVKPTQQIMLFTKKGMAVRFDESALRSLGRTARGVKGVNLKEEDYVVSCEVVHGLEEETILVVCSKGFGKRSSVVDFRITNRGTGGVKSIVTSERNGDVVGALSMAANDSALLVSSSGQTIRFNMSSLRVLGRNTQGVKLANLKDPDMIVAIQKIDGQVADAAGDADEEIATIEAVEMEQPDES
ncbi:MAG: gyrA [Chlamydiales bacterium]|jgi:DNA gyrase subunit A|nr:gyrA [Chlamydiales bacterium]